MRTLLALLLVVAAVGTTLLAVPALAATRTVSLRDNAFSPASLSVRRGDRVVFRWRGENPHNVRVRRGPTRFRSRIQSSGSYRVRLRRRGTYRLVCDVHPGMRMTLRVR